MGVNGVSFVTWNGGITARTACPSCVNRLISRVAKAPIGFLNMPSTCENVQIMVDSKTINQVLSMNPWAVLLCHSYI